MGTRSRGWRWGGEGLVPLAWGALLLAVPVVQNGAVLWEEGFGWADRENRVPATEHTTTSSPTTE